LYGDLNRILDVLALSDEEYAQQAELLPQRAITLERVLNQVLSFEAVIAALAAGFAEELNLILDEMPLTDQEQALVDELRAEQYANDKWIKRV
jgi:lipoate-protein ligase A